RPGSSPAYLRGRSRSALAVSMKSLSSRIDTASRVAPQRARAEREEVAREPTPAPRRPALPVCAMDAPALQPDHGDAGAEQAQCARLGHGQGIALENEGEPYPRKAGFVPAVEFRRDDIAAGSIGR